MAELNINDNYEEIDDSEVFVDDGGNIYENVDISPFDVIKALANKLGQTIEDPKPNCKHCHGRGYIGRDAETKAPIPCSCIYSKENKQKSEDVYRKTKKMTRSERREYDRKLKRLMKKGNI